MAYDTILVKKSTDSLTITFNRLEHRNSINTVFLKELNEILDIAEHDTACRVVVLEGQKGIFCTGMDFEEAVQLKYQGVTGRLFSSNYMETIKRFTLMPKVIISKVDGQVMAGGIGLVAASDLVIATSQSTFALSEVLWGLLPATVLPYLIRRVGFQKAYRMTLTTLPISAQEAYSINLVDEISEAPDENIRKLQLRLARLEQSSVGNLKHYFRKMWLITDQMEEDAVSEITKLISQPKVRENIRNYVEHQNFPWEGKNNE